jgi:hypothetical protein
MKLPATNPAISRTIPGNAVEPTKASEYGASYKTTAFRQPRTTRALIKRTDTVSSGMDAA